MFTVSAISHVPETRLESFQDVGGFFSQSDSTQQRHASNTERCGRQKAEA